MNWPLIEESALRYALYSVVLCSWATFGFIAPTLNLPGFAKGVLHGIFGTAFVVSLFCFIHSLAHLRILL